VTEKFLASNPGIVELTDAQLKQEFLQFLPDMERLNEGQISDCERYADFKAGGRRRRLLTQRMGHGGFSESQTEQLFSELNGRFAAATAVCSVNESIIIDSPAKKKQRSNDDDEINSNNSNDDEDDDDEEVKTTRFDDGGMHTLDFNSSVLLPELMIRILMKHRNCNRQQAEDILLNGDRQTGWASQLLAFRQMFQR
jgi:hypothetical protein